MALCHENEIFVNHPDMDIQGGVEPGTGKTTIFFKCTEGGPVNLKGPFKTETEMFNRAYWIIRQQIRNKIYDGSIFYANADGNIYRIVVKCRPEN